MKLSRPLAALSAVLLTTAGLAACSTDTEGSAEVLDDGTGVSVAVLTPYLGNATTKEVIDDFEEEGQERGWDVSVRDTAGDMNQLNSAFQDAVAQAPDAIVLGMGDPTQLSLGLTAAQDAGIPVFAIDAAEADGIAANVTSDNTDLGTQSARALVDAVGGSGSVVMLTHDPHPGVRERADGARAAFEEAGVTILEEMHIAVPGPVDDARAVVQDLMTARAAEVDGIWGGWDEPALGATQALEAAGITDVPVVGVDGQDFAVAEIDKGGPFVATIKQDWDAIAERVADLVQDQIDGTAPDRTQYELPGEFVGRD